MLSLLALLATANLGAHGGIPNDEADDREAFYETMSVAASDGTNEVYVPCGTWDITRTPGAGAETLGGVDVFSQTDLVFRGAGACSVIRMKFLTNPGDFDFFLFNVETSSNITFRDLVLDGNRSSVSGADEQTHLIRSYINAGLTVRDVIFRDNWGDAIKLTDTSDVLVEGGSVSNMGRNGFTLQNNVVDVVIDHVKFDHISDQAVDFEGSTGPKRITLSKLDIRDPDKGSVILTLNGGSDNPLYMTDDIKLLDSYIEGEIDIVHAGTTLLRGNTVHSRTACIVASRSIRDITITENVLSCDEGSRGTGVGASGLVFAQVSNGDGAYHVVVFNNTIRIGDSDVGRFAIEFLGGVGKNVVSHNRITSLQTSGFSIAISAKAVVVGNPIHGLQVEGNTIEGFADGLRLASARAIIDDVIYNGNLVADPPGVAAAGVICTGAYGSTVLAGVNLNGSGGLFAGDCHPHL